MKTLIKLLKITYSETISLSKLMWRTMAFNPIKKPYGTFVSFVLIYCFLNIVYYFVKILQ